MRWSFPIGRVSGITIRLHVTFVLTVLVFGLASYQELGWAGAVWAMTFLCAVFACIALHELGHSLVAQSLGVEVRSITLLPIGGVAALKHIPENPWHEIAITIAGPLVNAVIALLLLPLTGVPKQLFVITMPHSFPTLLVTMVQANLSLFVFNLLPAFPMDGGRLLRAVLALIVSYRRATTVATLVGQGIAIVLIMNGFGLIRLLPQVSSLWLLVIGIFIFFGAEGEERIVRRRSVLAEYQVADLMSRQFTTLCPTDTVERGLELVYQTCQDDFPVLVDGQLVGMAARGEMLEAFNKTGPSTIVSEVMDSEYLTAGPNDPVVQVHNEVLSEGWGSVPVLDGEGQLIGLLTPENISRFLVVHSVLNPAPHSAAPPVAAGHTPMPPPVMTAAPPVAVPPPPAGPVPPTGRV